MKRSNLMIRKPPNVNFNTIAVADDGISSDSEDEAFRDDENNPYISNNFMSMEFTVDLGTIMKTQGLKMELRHNDTKQFVINDTEYNLDYCVCQTINPNAPIRVEPIECVVINVAHLEQFPKPNSAYSSSLPSVFAWADMHNAFPSEYPTTIYNFYKSSYNSIRAHLRFFFSIAPTYDRLQNLASIRREVPAGRVLFHYIGYGFPTIKPHNIWISEKRSTQFQPYDLEQLFIRLKPPTWFIFDCSNAAVVITKFLNIQMAKQANAENDNIDWGDWFCICATGVGENLPDDPRLPHDFLTACILTPIKMAVLCHILQHYNQAIVGPKFPLDLPYQKLWQERSPDCNKLSLTLTAITDAIASDAMPHDLYLRIFRCDRLSAVLFRHFLLAQFLLRPYRVHPVSHPTIPDVSMHKLWRQWSVLLDSMINTYSVPRPLITSELMLRTAVSFKTMIQNNQFHLIRPYHLTLMFHMIFYDTNNDEPSFLLARYAASPLSNTVMLTSATVFHSLFAKMITLKDPKANAFHPLCFLILALLYFNPQFASEIRKELDASSFPMLLFRKDLHESTRVIIAAIIANLVTSHEHFQQTCNSSDFMDNIKDELMDAAPTRALWMLMIVQRTFHLYPPENNVFAGNGLYIQCAFYLFHNTPIVRAAAVAALTSFLRQFECNVNGQIFFMLLPVFDDVSFLVRFQILLFLKKFIILFEETYSDCEMMFPFTSISSILSSFYKCDHFDQKNYISIVDNIVHTPDSLKHAYTVALFLIHLYLGDPHPTNSSLADKILRATMKKASNKSPSNSSHASFSSIGNIFDDESESEWNIYNDEQNDSLLLIAHHNLILSQQWHIVDDDDVINEPPSLVRSLPYAPHKELLEGSHIILLNKIKVKSVVSLFFHKHSLGIAVGMKSSVCFIDEKQQKSEIPCDSVSTIKIVEWNDKVQILISTTTGCLFLWTPGHNSFDVAYRCANGPFVFTVSPHEKHVIFTITKENILIKWNLNCEKCVSEWPTGAQSEATSLLMHPTDPTLCYAGFKNGCIREMNLSTHDNCTVKDLIAQRPNVPIIDIKCSKVVDNMFFSIDKNGNADKWVDSLESIHAINDDNSTPCSSFDAHQLYPVMLFSPRSSNPFATDYNGNVIHIFKDNGPNSTCASHQLLPIFAIGTLSGDLSIYRLGSK